MTRYLKCLNPANLLLSLKVRSADFTENPPKKSLNLFYFIFWKDNETLYYYPSQESPLALTIEVMGIWISRISNFLKSYGIKITLLHFPVFTKEIHDSSGRIIDSTAEWVIRDSSSNSWMIIVIFNEYVLLNYC